MKALVKIIFLFSLLVGLYACTSKPSVKIEAIARVQEQSQMKAAIAALEKRMEKFNIPAVVSKINDSDLRIELTTDGDVTALKNNLLVSTKLEFYEVVPADFILQKMSEYSQKENNEVNIATKFSLTSNPNNPIIGFVATKDTLEVSTFLKSSFLMDDYELSENKLKFKWGVTDERGLHPLYLLMADAQGNPELGGDIINNAEQTYDQTNNPVVSMQMNKIAAKKWKIFTTRAYQEKFQIAIVLNNLVYSAPGIASPIPGGYSSITGDFKVEEAQRIATALRLGYLPQMKLLSFEEIKE